MGILGLPAVLKQFGVEVKLSEAGLKGKVVGVDLMVVLHAALPHKAVADQFWVAPIVPLTTVLEYVRNHSLALKHVGKVEEIVYICDGLTPPSKLAESLRRRELREKDVAALVALFDSGTVDSLDEISKLKKPTVYPRTDVVAVVLGWLRANGHSLLFCAPFEADGQLVYEELIGRLDCISTVDSDLFVLGAQWLLLDLKFSKTLKCWRFFSVKRALVMPQLDLEVLGPELVGQGRTLHEHLLLQEFCSFLGSDFVPQLFGNGWKKVCTYMRETWCLLPNNPAKHIELQACASTRVFSPANVAAGWDIGSYPALFTCSVTSLWHPPIMAVDAPIQDMLNWSMATASAEHLGSPLPLPGAVLTSSSGAMDEQLPAATTAAELSFKMARSPVVAPQHQAAFRVLHDDMNTVQRVRYLQAMVTDADGCLDYSRIAALIQPLHHSPDLDSLEWENLLGYSPSAVFEGKADELHHFDIFGDMAEQIAEYRRSCYIFVHNVRTGLPPADSLPQPPVRGAELLQYGSELNFGLRASPAFFGEEALKLWLFYRNVVPTKANATLENLSQCVLAKIGGNRGLTLDLMSAVNSAITDATTLGSYRISEPFTTDTGSVWDAGGDAILAAIRRRDIVQQLDGPTLTRLFGNFRSGVISRSKLRVTSGHYNLDTLKMTDAYNIQPSGKSNSGSCPYSHCCYSAPSPYRSTSL
ncbi:hypothetical protein B484DRAFT_482830 [Ochromonadaceae sp. CCMP2298]|nr:hypothetical protein B484DRAFT_482830 [Ochromonadaceae sp. CCMP2298]